MSGRRQGNNLEEWPVHYRNDTHSHIHTATHMYAFGLWEKPEHQKETQANTGKTQKSLSQMGFKPGAFFLWRNSATKWCPLIEM